MNRELRRRFETDAILIVAAIRDAYAPALWDSEKGGQVAMWLLDFAERVSANTPVSHGGIDGVGEPDPTLALKMGVDRIAGGHGGER